MRGNAFEQVCQGGWAVLGWIEHEKVHVIRHHFARKELEAVLNCDLVEQFSQAICHRSAQDAAAVLGKPDQVIIQIVHCLLLVRFTFIFLL
jgi:hypothetical protein